MTDVVDQHGVAYLLYFFQPLSWLLHASLSLPSLIGFAGGLGLFAVVYVWLMRRVLLTRGQDRLPGLVSAVYVAVLAALACALTLAGGGRRARAHSARSA